MTDRPTASPLDDRTVFQLVVRATQNPYEPLRRIRTSDVTATLRARHVVAATGTGELAGLPGTAVVLVATDDSGRVLVESDGDLHPAQAIEELVPSLAHALDAQIVVDGELVVLPDGSETSLDDENATEELEPVRTRAVYVMRLATETTSSLHALAGLARSAVKHATVGDWALAATPVGTPRAEAPALARREHPFAALVREGELRRVVWQPRPGARHALEVTALPDLEPLTGSRDGTDASALAHALATGHVTVDGPDTADDAPGSAVERVLAVERDAFFASVVEILGLPEQAAHEADRDPQDGPLLALAGSRRIEEPAGLTSAVGAGIKELVLEEPRGTSRYQRYRRFLWHRVGLLITLCLVQIGAGAGLMAWEVLGEPPLWPVVVWVAGGYLVLDGVSDLVAAIALLRRRRRADPLSISMTVNQ